MKRIVLLIAAVFCGFTSWAQDDVMLKYAETITADDLKKHLSILASDEYEGRETGEKGQKMAADYIYKHFKNNGLIGPVKSNTENSYYQPFQLVKTYWKDCKISTGAKTLNIFEHFFPYGRFDLEPKEMDVVFAGYGLDTDLYSDYKDLDVNGKVVVLLKGTPKLKKGSIESKDQSTSGKTKIAREKGAALVVIVYETDKEFYDKNLIFKGYYSKPSIGFDKGKKTMYWCRVNAPTPMYVM